MDARIARIRLTAMVGFMVFIATNPSIAESDPTAGRRLAQLECAYCHVVSADQGFEPPFRPHGPDFISIAANPKKTSKDLRVFLLTTHKHSAHSPSMPNPILTNNQISDVVSYILSLQNNP
tara:strand:- start:6 stop:368 length:363 start_codon:yes stop_codon:yes gene_type:complete